MIFDPSRERWPTVYDEEGLRSAIESLVTSETLAREFYVRAHERDVFQGDVVELQAELPILDETGHPALDQPFRYWLVVGNTCDFVRELAEVSWTQIVPIQELGAASESVEIAAALRRYQHSRQFYVPPWSDETAETLLCADFLRPATIHKSAFDGAAKVVARMSLPAWVLLHSCLIRFLARSDGRAT